MSFQLESDYQPRGDRGQAIAKLIKSVEAGNRHQTLLAVTGSEDYERMLLTVKRGQHTSREAVLGRLIDMLYERNDISFCAAN